MFVHHVWRMPPSAGSSTINIHDYDHRDKAIPIRSLFHYLQIVFYRWILTQKRKRSIPFTGHRRSSNIFFLSFSFIWWMKFSGNMIEFNSDNSFLGFFRAKIISIKIYFFHQANSNYNNYTFKMLIWF